MVIVDPNNTTHTTKVIPRFLPTLDIDFVLYNEVTKVESTVVDSYVYTDGILEITYDFNFSEDENYQIKITEGESVVYRGKLFATSQDAQDYDIEEGVYKYSTI
ncbi:hypothetical protein AB832_05235 [Flavobacteriaceae bacterium (ex Bugula neritina AB1)]|nr:hypothetical protein AB832_05235 [Flavobacteriaceae bacterium (ex Bugula neritina AB1)]